MKRPGSRWVAELHQEWAPATVKQAVSAVRSFFKWCEDYDTISKKQLRKLLKGLQVPKVPKNPQRTLSISEVKQLLAICDLGTPKGQRDTAMIGILMDTGLRASEICKLTVDQIKFDPEPFPGIIVNQLSSVTVKGGKEGLFFALQNSPEKRCQAQICGTNRTKNQVFHKIIPKIIPHQLSTINYQNLLLTVFNQIT